MRIEIFKRFRLSSHIFSIIAGNIKDILKKIPIEDTLDRLIKIPLGIPLKDFLKIFKARSMDTTSKPSKRCSE